MIEDINDEKRKIIKCVNKNKTEVEEINSCVRYFREINNFLYELTYQLIKNLKNIPTYTFNYLVPKYQLSQTQINQLYYDKLYYSILGISKYYPAVPNLNAKLLDLKKAEDMSLDFSAELDEYLKKKDWHPSAFHINYQARYHEFFYGFRNVTEQCFRIWIDNLDIVFLNKLKTSNESIDKLITWGSPVYKYEQELQFLCYHIRNFDEKYIPLFATKDIMLLYDILKKTNIKDIADILEKYWPVKEVYKDFQVNKYDRGITYTSYEKRLVRIRPEQEMELITPFVK